MSSTFNEIFGWSFTRKGQDEDTPGIQVTKIDSPYVKQENDDAAFVIGSNSYGHFSGQMSFDQEFKNEADMIQAYRDVALFPEVDAAVTEICNEAVSVEDGSKPVEIIMDDLKVSDKIKDSIRNEFDHILNLLKFNTESYEIFRKWYVDGRINYHIIIDQEFKKSGIKELRYIPPFNIKKVKEEKTSIIKGITMVDSVEEYFVYTPAQIGKNSIQANTGVILAKDSVCFVHSGLVDDSAGRIYSYLHKTIKPANQLKMMEDALVIYRVSRAPERRVFYVGVGGMTSKKSEEYLSNVANKLQNKIKYDAQTGEVKDQKNVMTMMEDLFLPRHGGDGRNTEVSTLPGAQNLGTIDDVEYFRKKLYGSLDVPASRILSDGGGSAFTIGRASEISREEVKLTKFIARLRKRFAKLFFELLRKQLILKNIITPSEWKQIAKDISFDFNSDNFFSELKKFEVLRERLGMVDQAKEYIGTIYSMEYIRKDILKLTDEEISTMKKQIEQERAEDPMMMMKFREMMLTGDANDDSNAGATEKEPSEEIVQQQENNK